MFGAILPRLFLETALAFTQQNTMSSLKNHLLIAMPSMQDPRFSRTVTYICEHNAKGAMGIVVNRPTDLHLSDIFDQMNIEVRMPDVSETTVFGGGPVEEQRGFVLHQPDQKWEATLDMHTSLSITTSRDILEAMAHGEGPHKSLIALGYAGWQAGQLEKEMRDNSWLISPSNNGILFDTPPEQRWNAAAGLLGVDLNLISSQSGHA